MLEKLLTKRLLLFKRLKIVFVMNMIQRTNIEILCQDQMLRHPQRQIKLNLAQQ
jgi:hypothetical protein